MPWTTNHSSSIHSTDMQKGGRKRGGKQEGIFTRDKEHTFRSYKQGQREEGSAHKQAREGRMRP